MSGDTEPRLWVNVASLERWLDARQAELAARRDDLQTQLATVEAAMNELVYLREVVADSREAIKGDSA